MQLQTEKVRLAANYLNFRVTNDNTPSFSPVLELRDRYISQADGEKSVSFMADSTVWRKTSALQWPGAPVHSWNTPPVKGRIGKLQSCPPLFVLPWAPALECSPQKEIGECSSSKFTNKIINQNGLRRSRKGQGMSVSIETWKTSVLILVTFQTCCALANHAAVGLHGIPRDPCSSRLCKWAQGVSLTAKWSLT